MRKVKFTPLLFIMLLLLLLDITIGDSYLLAKKSDVSAQYQKFFIQDMADKRSLYEKGLNLIGLSQQDVGRSFALIAGVYSYDNIGLLEPAQKDIENLVKYLTDYEFFDEIVVLTNKDMNYDSLEFFLKTYFPEQLKKYPKSRFLFAYSGHGITNGENGYLLKSTAKSLSDRTNTVSMNTLRDLINEVVETGYQVLVLLNACYSGNFFNINFGDSKYLPKQPGAHAITAGRNDEPTWAKGREGSIFFEKFFKALSGEADTCPNDGIITVDELATYLKKEVQQATNETQNPEMGPLTMGKSSGSFFFLNRTREVKGGIIKNDFDPKTGTSFGLDPAEALQKGNEYYKSKDYKSALTYFQQAAEAGNSEAMNNLGNMYYWGDGVTQSYTEAINWYRNGAEAGNADAMNNLGWMYQYEIGVTQNYTEAVNWYRKGAEAGNADAMCNLGYMFDKGLGVTQSYTEAVDWYRKGAEAGNTQAMNNLVWMYQKGLGVTQSYTEAVDWYRKGAEAGNTQAMNNLGWMYQNGLGITQSYTEAVNWYRKGAEAGGDDAMNNLGYMYEKGLGVTKSYTEAVNWYRKGAEAGNADAMCNLGYMYEKGLGLTQSYIDAVNWYRKGAEADNTQAMNNLGWMYQYGLGITQNYSEAVNWYRKGAEAGNADAMCNLGYMYEKGFGIIQSYTDAVNWYRKGAEAGNANAMNNLGYMYEQGYGVTKSYNEAVSWYRKAANLGNEDAKKNLARLGEKL